MRAPVRWTFPLLALVLLPTACATPLPVDGERMLERVRHQVAAGPRVLGSASHAAIREWIAGELTRLGGRVERQSFTDSTLGRPLPLTNFIGRFGPSGGRRIALCAHYDSRPWCDEDPDTSMRHVPVQGANDGGSGVAVLLEMAELLHGRAPPVGVDLVFFDGEDLGTRERPGDFCLGSKGYASRLPAAGAPERPVAAFLFDMVGGRDLKIYAERNSSARAANLVALVSTAAHATHATGFHDEARWTIVDDHIPLNDAGLPAVDILDFDYPAWHTHRDTPDQLSAASLAQVGRVAAWILYTSPLSRP
jgi:glutaminyl-peptide cyclotransferase